MAVNPKRERKRLYSDEPIGLDGRSLAQMKDMDRKRQAREAAGLEDSLASVDRMILEDGGTVADLVAPDVDIAREALLRAAKTATRYEDPEIHLQVVKRRESLEDLMTFLSDRTQA